MHVTDELMYCQSYSTCENNGCLVSQYVPGWPAPPPPPPLAVCWGSVGEQEAEVHENWGWGIGRPSRRGAGLVSADGRDERVSTSRRVTDTVTLMGEKREVYAA
ncbi:hypothetical protein FKM82_026143 [Ascaphus truei]